MSFFLCAPLTRWRERGSTEQWITWFTVPEKGISHKCGEISKGPAYDPLLPHCTALGGSIQK